MFAVGSIESIGMSNSKCQMGFGLIFQLNTTSENCLSKEFFVEAQTGQPNATIVVGSGAASMDVVTATMIAVKIGTMTADIDEARMVILDTDLDFAGWNTVCDYNLILIGGPVTNIIVKQLADEGISTVDWVTSPGELEYISNPYGNGCDILVVGGKDGDAVRQAGQLLIECLDTSDLCGICADSCTGVHYPKSKCYDCDLWAMKCVDGEVVQDYLIEENSKECGSECPCKDVICDSQCYGYDLWIMKCVDGKCVQDKIIEENSKECGYPPPILTIFLYVVLPVTAIIVIIVLILKKKKPREEREPEEKPQVLFCPQCKNRIQEDWDTCPYCKIKLNHQKV